MGASNIAIIKKSDQLLYGNLIFFSKIGVRINYCLKPIIYTGMLANGWHENSPA